MKNPAHGFTLIELMVVIAITAVIGIYTLANYNSFGEDQNLNNAVLDLQSLLRQAQTSATTNVICNTQSDATWQVVFSDNETIKLNCLESGTPFTKKTLILNGKDQNLLIQSVSVVTGTNCSVVPFTLAFALLSGSIYFEDSRCISLSINLKNSQTGTVKSLYIEQGGRIYVP